jgi:hypothetical protein
LCGLLETRTNCGAAALGMKRNAVASIPLVSQGAVVEVPRTLVLSPALKEPGRQAE